MCACVTIYLLDLQVRFSCHIAHISHITYHISGVRLRLRGSEPAWLQPRGPYHYHDLPATNASLPKFWWNEGKGGARLVVNESSGTCTLEAYTGAISVGSSSASSSSSSSSPQAIQLHFDLVLTPNKPLDVQQHFEKQRYYQMESQLVAPTTLVQEDGVKIVNVHQGNQSLHHLTTNTLSSFLRQVTHSTLGSSTHSTQSQTAPCATSPVRVVVWHHLGPT